MDALQNLITVLAWGAGVVAVLIIGGIVAMMRYQSSGEERGE